ncbi:MAG TPA: hypothetical protein VGS97_26320 [Actinocrinis sp.]|uniref:hypothetical protein n=1 Tax=Actinocrinis sp. TaxID=1920516 RepID=UPI002DDD9AF9|nr:hypothetical protein [Actinocrinis sp.]HEV2347634.1 hypothetical protein [Actinocrinis sp.]
MTTRCGLRKDKSAPITGVITESPITFHVPRVAQKQGSQVPPTGFGQLSPVKRTTKHLPNPTPVIAPNVTNNKHPATPKARTQNHTDHPDEVPPTIASPPANTLGGNQLETSHRDAATASNTSAISPQSVTAAKPLRTLARSAAYGQSEIKQLATDKTKKAEEAKSSDQAAHSPLCWATKDFEPTAKPRVTLPSDRFPATTKEICTSTAARTRPESVA